MKTLQDPADMLRKMADSMNLSVPEFTKMMGEEHGLVPPDEEDDGPNDEYDYGPHYSPPKRVANPLIITAEDYEEPIAILRDQMLNPELGRYRLDEIAQVLAHYIVASGDLGRRIAEIKAGIPYTGDALANAMRSEYEALYDAQTDKQLTTQRFGKSSGAMAVSAMSGHRIYGQPIDLLELKTTMEDQMKALADSGAERRDKLAMLALQAQQAGEALMIESASAATGEAKALILKSAVSNFATAAKITEQLHNLSEPTGMIVDGHSTEGKQLSNKTKKLGGKK